MSLEALSLISDELLPIELPLDTQNILDESVLNTVREVCSLGKDKILQRSDN